MEYADNDPSKDQQLPVINSSVGVDFDNKSIGEQDQNKI